MGLGLTRLDFLSLAAGDPSATSAVKRNEQIFTRVFLSGLEGI